jgi:hypothetical protein
MWGAAVAAAVAVVGSSGESGSGDSGVCTHTAVFGQRGILTGRACAGFQY